MYHEGHFLENVQPLTFPRFFHQRCSKVLNSWRPLPSRQASKRSPLIQKMPKRGRGRQAGNAGSQHTTRKFFFLIPDSLNMRTRCLMQAECEQSNTRNFFQFSSIWAIIELQKVDHFVSQRSVGSPPLRPILCYTRPPTHKREEEGLLHFVASKVAAAAVKMRDSSPLLPLFSPHPPPLYNRRPFLPIQEG